MTTPPTRKRTRALLLVIEFPRKVLVGNENKYGDENNEKGVAYRYLFYFQLVNCPLSRPNNPGGRYHLFVLNAFKASIRNQTCQVGINS
jgi:hypothetical protein